MKLTGEEALQWAKDNGVEVMIVGTALSVKPVDMRGLGCWVDTISDWYQCLWCHEMYSCSRGALEPWHRCFDGRISSLTRST